VKLSKELDSHPEYIMDEFSKFLMRKKYKFSLTQWGEGYTISNGFKNESRMLRTKCQYLGFFLDALRFFINLKPGDFYEKYKNNLSS
jgi:hypothetical protein